MSSREGQRTVWQALLIVWLAFALLAGSMLPAFSDRLIRLCGG